LYGGFDIGKVLSLFEQRIIRAPTNGHGSLHHGSNNIEVHFYNY
jgi:hypothetical protein